MRVKRTIATIIGACMLMGCGEVTPAAMPTETPTPAPSLPYEELEVVGLTQLKDIQITENGNMTIIRAKTDNRQEYEVLITLEDGKVIYIQMSALMGDTAILFDDVSGGYLAVYDSEENTIKEYEK